MTEDKKIITRTLHTAADLHVREAGEGEPSSRMIMGYAILFNTPSAVMYADEDEEIYEVIAPEAITGDFLNSCDIKMTMFHNMQLILARSKNGSGTLTYKVDEKGVYFEFDAPNTADGDKALELVRRGDISGCSFMFSTHYFDEKCVSCEVQRKDNKIITTYTVRVMTGVYDFTLTPDPAYPDTSCEAESRALFKDRKVWEGKKNNKGREQVREMRNRAAQAL